MRLLAATLAALLCGCSTVRDLIDRDPARVAREAERRASEMMVAPKPNVNDLLTQGDRLRDGGDVSQAAWTYLKAMRLDPTRSAAGERIAFLHLAKGDIERAESMFDSVLKTAPESAPAMTGRGLAQLRAGNLADARASLQRAMELDPESEIALLALGLVCDWTGQAEEARRHYTRALELDPVSIEAENNLGVSYLLSGDSAQAEPHLRRAVQLDPKDGAHHNNLALALCDLGRFDEALAAFRTAGGEAVAQNNLGYVHHRRGDYAAAIRHYELALAATPADSLPIIRNLRRAQDDLDRSLAPAPASVPAPSTTAP